MRQEFYHQLDQAGWSKNRLKVLIERIDAEKRSIKSRLSQLSSEPREGDPAGRQRQALIRRIKDKLSFITEEREAVRARLGQIKVNQASLCRAKNTKAGFSDAFVAAAEHKLNEQLFLEIEQLAASILMQSE